jgi:hypothetical protein
VATWKDRYFPALAAALVVAAVLATNPVLEMGVNDDWSYAWIARHLAATGHFAYNGWVGTMLGLQAAWGALLIRIFGFSFTLLRLSTLPFAAGCAILLYRFGRAAGLNPHFALFASLSVILCPVFIPMSASYMTDIPGTFLFLAVAWCAWRALDGHLAWVIAAALLGVLGTTVRQIVWFVPLTSLPIVAWVRRRDHRFRNWTLSLWCASLLLTALCIHWYNTQPYVFADIPHEPQSWADTVFDGFDAIEQTAICCLLLILPVQAALFPGVRVWLAPRSLIIGLACSSSLVGLMFWFDDRLLLGNIITATGILGQSDLLGQKPWLLTDPIQISVGLFLYLSTTITAATVAAAFSKLWSPPLLRLALILAPPTLLYAAAVVYRYMKSWIIFDRYLILLLPLLVIPLLWICQQSIRNAPPVRSWVLLAIGAAYGMALTHDYLADARARLQAATTVTSTGIPRSHVSAGFEYDGWTELEQNGRILSLDELAALPPSQAPIQPAYWFWKTTRHVDPVYIVAFSPLKGLADSGFPTIRYRIWLPPFHRQVVTQRVPGRQ